MDEIMGIVADAMESIGLRYDYEEWGGEVEYPYFVGHMTETEPTTEDGEQGATFLITGWSRASFLELRKAANAIRDALDGKRGATKSGNGYAVWYAGSTDVPTDKPELKSIQINLNAKIWRAE